MISMGNLIKVAEAMLPLYMPLGLGYVSLRWWRLISPEQCQAIDRLVYSITLPLFTLQFTLHMDPFAMNYRMIAADAISKVLVAALLVAWTSCRRWLGHRDQERPSYCWAITGFSLTQLTNSLVVGVPLVTAMYGPWARDVVVQLSVVQAVVWLPLLQFVLEIRKARCGQFSMASEAQEVSIEAPPPPAARDLEGGTEEGAELAAARPSYCSLIKVVLLSLAKNPNSYACIIGITWAFLANKWQLNTPSVIENSIQIMSTAGPGMAMYSIGLFMASQKKILICELRSTAQAMMLKFICGPAAMAIGAFSVGLRSEMLHLAIIQAAMPQSITSFIFAKEYELDADVLSTAVTFGMLVFLPVLVLYTI
ncbi:auxin efflux carrier component 5-like [Zingiber officinale]|uniref:auxin efflux carrier component 5-like n=1 Tax=Zingiber officinale TaxID=94328 RepID=UPI001C4AEAF9|nr:auxin efflux carrier component 5-like [Zingiber officinale]